MKTIWALVFASAALAQGPQFEVASVKPSGPGAADYSVSVGVHIDGAQVSCNYFSLQDFIAMAYELKQYQVIAPEWMAGARYDVKARIPEGSDRSHIREMFQSLLAERFHMKVHKDTKEFPVYALVQDKSGSKLKESVGDDTPIVPGANVTGTGGPQGVSMSLGNGAFFSFADNKVQGQKLAMVQFADMMSRFSDKPVIDMTGLAGRYDFEIKLSDEDYNAMRIRSAISAGIQLPPQAMKLLEIASGDSLANALKALGLKMEARKAPLPILVVESADKTPTEN